MTWWNSSFRFRIKVNLLTSSYLTASVSNDHAIPIFISNTQSDFWSHVKSDGSDVRIVAADNSTELPFHFEKWDYAGQSAVIWYKHIDTFLNSANGSAFIYYGNSDATDAQNVNGTYPSAYKTVYHLNETADPQLDSTSSGNDLSSSEDPDVVRGTDAKINGGNYYSGGGMSANDVPATNLTFGTGAFSFSCWVNQDSNSNYTIVKGVVDGSTDWLLQHSATKKFEFRTYTASGSQNFNRSTSNSIGVFYHLACIRSGNSAILYVNGVQEETGLIEVGSVKDYGQPTLLIGELMPGYVDELKFFDYALSQDETILLFQAENGNLIMFDDEEVSADVDLSSFTATLSDSTITATTAERGVIARKPSTDFTARVKDLV